jgi:hypothetical protein
MSPAVQLSLFPRRGYGLLLSGFGAPELAIRADGEVALYADRQSAERAWRRQASYLHLCTAVVPLEKHDACGCPACNGLPTFLVGDDR